MHEEWRGGEEVLRNGKGVENRETGGREVRKKGVDGEWLGNRERGSLDGWRRRGYGYAIMFLCCHDRLQLTMPTSMMILQSLSSHSSQSQMHIHSQLTTSPR